MVNKFEENFLRDLLKTMDELKDHENRDQFCFNFDIEYEKLKLKIADLDRKVK